VTTVNALALIGLVGKLVSAVGTSYSRESVRSLEQCTRSLLVLLSTDIRQEMVAKVRLLRFMSIEGGFVIFSRKYTLTVTEEMHRRLEEERKRRFLHSIPETIRMIVSEYLASASRTRDI
jgi:hypothetical protein